MSTELDIVARSLVDMAEHQSEMSKSDFIFSKIVFLLDNKILPMDDEDFVDFNHAIIEVLMEKAISNPRKWATEVMLLGQLMSTFLNKL